MYRIAKRKSQKLSPLLKMAEIYQVYEAISSNTHMFLTELDKTNKQKQTKKNNKKTKNKKKKQKKKQKKHYILVINPVDFVPLRLLFMNIEIVLNYTECRYKEG